MECEIRKMCLKVLIAGVVVVLTLSNVADSKLSDYTTICKAKDPELEKCLISSGQKLFLAMEKGIPEFDIKPVDPMAVPQLSIQRTEIGMSLVLSNSTHRGLAQAKIYRAKADPIKRTMEFHLTLPSYSIIGHYSVNGKVMLLPIKGDGQSNITLYDLDVTWKLYGEQDVRGGVDYMKLKSLEAKIQPKLMKVHFENLFSGNKLLGDTMNNLLNDQWKEVFRKIQPPLEKSYSKLMLKFATKIFSKTPYNEIFSDN